MTERELRW